MFSAPSEERYIMTNQLNIVYLDKINLPISIGAVFRSLLSKLSDYSEKRAACSELMKLDDHMLEDIGIVRSDIQAVVSGVQSPNLAAKR
jgi:uncharacterized protein YjiS (DUF1127 family)